MGVHILATAAHRFNPDLILPMRGPCTNLTAKIHSLREFQSAMLVTVTLNTALDKTLHVPGFSVGQHARAELVSLIAAGKGINVARGIVRMGGTCVASGLVGTGEWERYSRVLEEEGVRCALTGIDGVTRTNTTILDPKNNTTTHLREEGMTTRQEDLERLKDRILELLADQPDGGLTRVVFAGSLPPGVSSEELIELIRMCREEGARTVLDTSGDTLYRAVESGMVDTIKPNLQELGQCLRREVEQEECPGVAARLLDRVDAVLLTLGAEGAYFLRAGERVGVRCRLESREVANTVGCGDAFLAGWLEGREHGKSPRSALAWAAAAGAASARGQTTVDYSRSDVEELLARCETLCP